MLWYLGYVVLFADDFDSLLRFYSDKVGLPVRLVAEGYVEFAVEGAKFALLSRGRLPEMVGQTHAERPKTGCHEGSVTVLVEDVDRHYGAMVQRGVRFLAEPQDRPWGQRSAYFEDPEGHLIELATNLPRPARLADPSVTRKR
jgi:lactoylglutathione lyase